MTRKIALLAVCILCAVCQSWAQTKTISGKVVDSIGEPMVGVTVSVKDDSRVHTLTGPDGKFKFSVPATAQFIVFTYVGFTEQTVDIRGKEVVNVSLKSVSTQLDDVVVTGFQNISKRSLPALQ